MRSERSRFSLVLISEDPHVQRTASWILLEEGYYVAVCATARLAAAQAAELSADAVLWDVGVRRGLDDELAVLRRAFPAARLVAIHLHDDSPIAHVDVECHLHTPFTAEDLLTCVAEALTATVGQASVHVHG